MEENKSFTNKRKVVVHFKSYLLSNFSHFIIEYSVTAQVLCLKRVTHYFTTFVFIAGYFDPGWSLLHVLEAISHQSGVIFQLCMFEEGKHQNKSSEEYLLPALYNSHSKNASMRAYLRLARVPVDILIS